MFAISLVYGARALAWGLASHPARSRVIARVQQDLAEAVGLSMSEGEAWIHYCELLFIGAQHLTGGLLFLPALLSVGPEHLRVPLVCVGALSEVAFDVYDTVKRTHQHLTAGGKPRGGLGFLLFILAHHQLSILFALPMNLHYASNPYFQHMTFNLMGAGGVAVFASSAAQTLDVSTRRGLWAMRALNMLLYTVMLYTRVIAYVPLSALLLHTFWRDGAWRLFALGAVGLTAMGLFNAIVMRSMHSRMLKFWQMQEASPPERTEPHPKSASVQNDDPNAIDQAASAGRATPVPDEIDSTDSDSVSSFDTAMVNDDDDVNAQALAGDELSDDTPGSAPDEQKWWLAQELPSSPPSSPAPTKCYDDRSRGLGQDAVAVAVPA
eukprot:CAMPEP_0119411608 /NCGR_PEP_ID=MMETSP1335-20130426/4296_1 /TAXON_ID=259385 /ORGANISM="Chrysoculter rhomboideus, Strain RCC1486" /LENGTH=379 /DNA_ID=CAMNT_0007436265 /DNA_START=178 /DNA_END=1317 /DNA_ORIENTATION=+